MFLTFLIIIIFFFIFFRASIGVRHITERDERSRSGTADLRKRSYDRKIGSRIRDPAHTADRPKGDRSVGEHRRSLLDRYVFVQKPGELSFSFRLPFRCYLQIHHRHDDNFISRFYFMLFMLCLSST